MDNAASRSVPDEVHERRTGRSRPAEGRGACRSVTCHPSGRHRAGPVGAVEASSRAAGVSSGGQPRTRRRRRRRPLVEEAPVGEDRLHVPHRPVRTHRGTGTPVEAGDEVRLGRDVERGWLLSMMRSRVVPDRGADHEDRRARSCDPLLATVTSPARQPAAHAVAGLLSRRRIGVCTRTSRPKSTSSPNFALNSRGRSARRSPRRRSRTGRTPLTPPAQHVPDEHLVGREGGERPVGPGVPVDHPPPCAGARTVDHPVAEPR